MKKTTLLLSCLIICAMLLASCANGTAEKNGAQDPTELTAPTEDTGMNDEDTLHYVSLSGHEATLDGVSIPEYDYTWHCDPTTAHTDVKDAPAEYYTGTKPSGDDAIYIDSELYYYPDIAKESFKKVTYDGENEWVCRYSDGENDEYIFATLPAIGDGLPTEMMHTEQQAAENRVLHITEAGTYCLTGDWKGQIKVDLGDKDDVFDDPDAKVTVVLNGVDITCTVAPGIIFEHAYECDNKWEDTDEHTADADLGEAGVKVIIADGTENTVTGENVFRMLKTKYKNDDDTSEIKVQKKMRKYDGAFYSCVSMIIDGEKENSGRLTVNSGFEGIDSELHLAFCGGNIVVNSQDDGVNVNEDHVSVAIFDGANIEVNAAQGAEGDGVDSNGYIVVKSGTVSVNGIRMPDFALDSDDGVYYYGGDVVIDGEKQETEPGSMSKELGSGKGNGAFAPGETFDLENFKQKVAELPDDATLDDIRALIGMGGERPALPDGDQGGERPGIPGGAPGENPPPDMRMGGNAPAA